jgi:hypothetical protein
MLSRVADAAMENMATETSKPVLVSEVNSAWRRISLSPFPFS